MVLRCLIHDNNRSLKYKVSSDAFFKMSGLILFILSVVTACVNSIDKAENPLKPTEENTAKVARWYTQTQQKNGFTIYKKHCLECHKENATGAKN